MAKEIAALVGDNITNLILTHTDRAQLKKVDEFQLHQLVTVVMKGAERPNLIAICRQKADIMVFEFD